MPVACLEASIPTDVITALHMLWSLRKDKTTYEHELEDEPSGLTYRRD